MTDLTTGHAITSGHDDHLVSLIGKATERLVFVAPGLSLPVAAAIGRAWQALGRDAVNVILDVDPEVCRLGYGCVEAIECLEQTAAALGAMVRHQPGIRIGLLAVDSATLVFAPLPALVESGQEAGQPKVNAIHLNQLPLQVRIELGCEDNPFIAQVWGLDPVKRRQVVALQDDLAHNPPLKFDLARHVRVFNARFEFVEFELKGCQIEKQSVPIKSDLMGLARDPKAQRLLRSNYKVVEAESTLSGREMLRRKKEIADRYLVTLPNYGTVILRTNRAAFESEVETFRKEIGDFQKRIVAELQKEMDSNRESLTAALAPAVQASPPERWQKALGPYPTKEEVSRMLARELEHSFGSAAALAGKMDVRLVFKSVTYDSLVDKKFMDVASNAFPALVGLHEEYDAAPEAPAEDEWKLL